MPPPDPGTGMPRTFFGLLPRRAPRTAPPIRPAAPVANPATTATFEPPPFCFCADDERSLAALVFEPALLEAPALAPLLFEPLLFAVVPERGLAFALEPLERGELFFWLLDESVFVCAITPPWVLDDPWAKKIDTPMGVGETLWITLRVAIALECAPGARREATGSASGGWTAPAPARRAQPRSAPEWPRRSSSPRAARSASRCRCASRRRTARTRPSGAPRAPAR